MCALSYCIMCIRCTSQWFSFVSRVSFAFVCVFFFVKQKTAYEMRISDWSSDVCSSDLQPQAYAVPADLFGERQSLLDDPVIEIVGGRLFARRGFGSLGSLASHDDPPMRAWPFQSPAVR